MRKIISAKRALSFLLVIVMTLGIVGVAPVSADPGDVVSLSAEDVSVVEGTNGINWIIIGEGGEWFRYEYEGLITFTATLKDGRTLKEDMYQIQAITGLEINFTDDQAPDHLWGVGKHEVTYTAGSFSGTVEINVVESPVAKFEAKALEIVEGTHGYWTATYDEMTGEINGYYFQYTPTPDEVTVTLKNGKTFKGAPYEVRSQILKEIDLGGYYGIFFDSDQDEGAIWSPGAHKAYGTFLGMTCEFDVTVKENNVASIASAEAVTTIVPYTNGWYEGYWKDEVFIPGAWYIYAVEPEYFTVTEKGGNIFTGTAKDLKQKYGDSVETFYYDAQGSYENRWEEGTDHEVFIGFMGRLAKANISVGTTPVKSVSASDTTITEYTCGFYDDGWEGMEWRDHYWYHYSLLPSEITVEFEDNTSFTGTPEELEEKYGSEVVPRDTQDQSNQLGVGSFPVDAKFMGVAFSYGYEITKGSDTPVAVTGVDFRDVEVEWNDRTFDDDGNTIYLYAPDFTVHFSDGTSVKSQDGGAGVNKKFVKAVYDDGQFKTPWTEWSTHKIKISFEGFEGEITVTVKGEFEIDYLPGDVDGNGKLNAKDVTAIMKYLVGAAPKNFNEAAADFDANGKINAKDVTKLMKYLVTK